MNPVQPLARRALLGFLVASPVVAAVPALTAPHPDAELLELARQHALAGEAAERLTDEACELERRAAEQRPAKPQALTIRKDDWYAGPSDIGTPFAVTSVHRWRAALASGDYRLRMTPRFADVFASRGREVVEAFDAHAQACEAALVATGYRRAQELAEAAWRVHFDLEGRLFATPATTPEGMKAKARVVAHVIGEPDGTYEDAVTRSLLADLLGRSAPACGPAVQRQMTQSYVWQKEPTVSSD
jgi:hypothetical protein